MRDMMLAMVSGIVAAGLLAGCSDNGTTAVTPPTTTPPATTPPATTPPSSGTIPTTAAVSVGDIFFKSVRNGTSNPAVDTVATNGTVTWTWAAGETLPHSVHSTGSPSFTSSGIQTGAGSTYQVTFATAGNFQYNCAVHGNMMTGTIVVLAAAGAAAPATPTTPMTPTTPTTPTTPPGGY